MAQILFYDLLRLSQFKLSYPIFSKKYNHANPYCTYLASRSMTCCLKSSTSCPNTKVDEQINNANVVLENMTYLQLAIRIVIVTWNNTHQPFIHFCSNAFLSILFTYLWLDIFCIVQFFNV